MSRSDDIYMSMSQKKTMHDVYEIGNNDIIVHRCLSLFKASAGEISWLETLTTAVCYLAESRAKLIDEIIQLKKERWQKSPSKDNS